ncbi:lysophospholipase [Cutibacterium sp. WCA-380-WT-3A]|uniref:Lysophospholipase n=1 Tax=Cutibacterium porci TaxID=2605781 RepID=A0A7K0J8R7_9ACTN|nr:alpha/beta fold hydrolase [Cutibacterium porci]MSS46339.1 lysophospholipase [Cutibacterium porci]
MALIETPFASRNDRDEIQAWIYTPATTPRAVVHLIHGLGEHSRRYIHLINAFLDAGFIVAATDHAGHGRTAALSGVWQDAGDNGDIVVRDDELQLAEVVSQRFPGLPYVVFGHSWGSIIARDVASARPDPLAGLALCGVAAQIPSCDDPDMLAAVNKAIAEHGDQSIAPDDLVNRLFGSFFERIPNPQAANEWVACDPGVCQDHATDPFNNFGAPMTLRFFKAFLESYLRTNDPSWITPLHKDLPVLILSGSEDPVSHYGEGALHVANDLHHAGLHDVRSLIIAGMRHEVHNEPESRAFVEQELVTFVEHCIG